MGGKSEPKEEWDLPLDVTKGSPIEKITKATLNKRGDFKKLQKLRGDNSSKTKYKKDKK
tara:strand:- start:982 stop:1158 length:177 start_codon:yes stop_codon:yes gene_type:complete